MHHADARVDDVVRRAGLDRLVARKVGKCSGGEQQRLRFALALLPDPQLLILDEPTAGMDAGVASDRGGATDAVPQAAGICAAG